MGTIYRKTCETGKIYYGSFVGTWEHRCSTGWAKVTCKDFINPTHEFIEIVEGNKKDLVKREYHYIQNYDCVNEKGKYANLTTNEYKKQHYDKNEERISQGNKEYRSKNKEKISEQKKEYYVNNKDNLAQYQKEYRSKNREAVNAKKREQISCDHCGSLITLSCYARHRKSKKCLESQ